MELLIAMPAGKLRSVARPGRSLRFAVGASVAAHAALVSAALLAPAYGPFRDEAPIVVDVVTEVMAPPEAEAPQPPPPQVKHVVVKRSAPMLVAAAPPPPAATPTPAEEPTSETAPEVAAAPDKTAGDGPPVLVAAMPPGRSGAGAAGGGVGALGAGGPPVLSGAQRTSMVGHYRDGLRNRIRDRFRYPPEARELELEGQVMVQVTVDKAGRVRAARLSGNCPHPMLCDDALRTIRAAAPFSPLPVDLGDSLQIEVPLTYNFQ